MEIKEMISLHEDFLEDFGFSLDQEIFHFIKKIPQGKQIIFFHHTQQPEVSYLEYHLGIRFDIVEVIINQFLPSSGDYQDRSITLVETVDSINKSIPRRFLVENELEINAVIKEAEHFLVKEGFKWLDEYSNPLNMERLFNDATDFSKVSQNFTYRSARGVTLSKLYNPAEYQNVKTFYLEKLEEKQETPFTLASFLNLLDYLDNL
ncbi:hypothetical protein P872_04685 [Rhodonellum psychrophilum GCM71 = DSM 17998]|uniref:Uncharacterized protein n=2 Tax=Rhodonellum TaxID=336827 RepID=U5BYF7_9BACT|nr:MULTISPECIES: hypothetical protein [Rhodonellum]ERM82614.1 hypothetical protein P872_04685 [Rhodonellum psychrophilum GCM71 = DSM 17998]SDZ53620.1 hypothetical protein SAMN05444412_12149 [Rhodonellum ikkaensis]